MKSLDPSARIAFLGGGNMAEAIIQGMIQGNVCSPTQIVVTDLLPDRVETVRQTLGVTGTTDGVAALSGADVVFLAVKPQVMRDAVQGVASAISPDALVISIAAGLSINTLADWFADRQRIIRVMPNTPCLVQQGASALAAGPHAEERDLDLAECCLGATGLVLRVSEDKLDAVTALSGSGPAYFFYFIEAMLGKARDLGLTEAEARSLALATMRGAAELLDVSGKDPETLRANVTSKGGTTEAALQVLVDRDVGPAIQQAMQAAYQRSRELSGS